MRGEKVLITGVAGQIAFPMARALAADNEVYGVARFTDPAGRTKVESAGIRPIVCDVSTGDFAAVPDDITVVIHLAAYMQPGADYDEAMRHNAEGTGLLLQHCRGARAALVMSTHSVYKPHPDPMHVFHETDPLGDCNSQLAVTYSISKIGQEAVARFCSRAFDLPVTIARMNASYGPNGGLPAMHVDAMLTGNRITTRWDPCMYSPIFEDDINAQVGALLDAATTPATVVNWAGDEPVSVQEYVAYAAELLGMETDVAVTPIDGTLRGSIADNTTRLAITGPCTVGWREGIRRVVDSRR